MNNKNNERHASRIDNIHIKYKCIYDKKVCSQRIHKHGSLKSLSKRKTHVITHCRGDEQNGISSIYLIVDENTKKI
jgi:hypothetical protein